MSRRAAVLSFAALLAVPTLARADGAACTKMLGKQIGALVKGRLKAISRCEGFRSSGKLPPATVCRPQCSSASTNAGTPCFQDADCPSGTCSAPESTTAASLQNLRAKVDNKVLTPNACGGVSPLPPIGAGCENASSSNELSFCALDDPLSRPNLLTPNRNNPLTADSLARTIYGTAAPVDPTLVKCQAGIAKAEAAYLNTRIKVELKCQTAVVGGKSAGPCPDAPTQALLANARDKLDASIRKRCTEAQLASASPNPELKFGQPCEAYKLVSFKRDGNTNNNTIPVTDRLIGCLADAAAGVADREVGIAYPGAETSAFTLGVAAGDATDTTAIFWTKLPDSTMGAQLDIATDAGFTTGLQTINVSSPAGADGIVKEDVGSLVAHTRYFYRFRQGSETSAAGRVTTTPSPLDSSTIVRLGWSGDSNAFYRPYGTLDFLRLFDADAWFYIGDTIYGDDAAADGVDAMVQPEYEAKYRLNRADGALRHLMESTGSYVQWDDHEVRNDFAGAEPALASRMAAGNAAFRRYMPLRENLGDPTQLYRSFRIGSTAEFFLIDDRQYRSAKYTCCGNAGESGFVTTDDDTTCHMSSEALLPSMSCSSAMAGPTRTILGSAQKTWLENGLLNSTATFKFIMNGPPVTELLFQPYDRWEAWPAERDEILGYVETNAIKNVVWLSTDLHAVVYSPSFLNTDLTTHPGTELVVGAIGETTLFRELPTTVVNLLPSVAGILKQASEYDIDRYNTVAVTLDPTNMPPTAEFDVVDRTGAFIHTVILTATP
jgi:alkaline phosphatase D